MLAEGEGYRSRDPVGESGDPVERDFSGDPVRKRDRSGDPVRERDRSGDPVRERDRSGDLVRERDRSGDPVRERDRLGDPVGERDRSGDPAGEGDQLLECGRAVESVVAPANCLATRTATLKRKRRLDLLLRRRSDMFAQLYRIAINSMTQQRLQCTARQKSCACAHQKSSSGMQASFLGFWWCTLGKLRKEGVCLV